jgi:hypothetical protein
MQRSLVHLTVSCLAVYLIIQVDNCFMGVGVETFQVISSFTHELIKKLQYWIFAAIVTDALMKVSIIVISAVWPFDEHFSDIRQFAVTVLNISMVMGLLFLQSSRVYRLSYLFNTGSVVCRKHFLCLEMLSLISVLSYFDNFLSGYSSLVFMNSSKGFQSEVMFVIERTFFSWIHHAHMCIASTQLMITAC